MFDKKAEENRKLIEGIYEDINEVKLHIQKLEKANEFAKVLLSMKKEIKDDIVKELISRELTKMVAASVLSELEKRKAGLI